jgi:hypothetical protein
MSTMSAKNRTSTRQVAKGTGILDQLSLRRKRVAALFSPATVASAQAAPASIPLSDLPAAWGSRTAPAYATGFLRQAPSAEASASGFSKLMRSLTKQKTE